MLQGYKNTKTQSVSKQHERSGEWMSYVLHALAVPVGVEASHPIKAYHWVVPQISSSLFIVQWTITRPNANAVCSANHVQSSRY